MISAFDTAASVVANVMSTNGPGSIGDRSNGVNSSGISELTNELIANHHHQIHRSLGGSGGSGSSSVVLSSSAHSGSPNSPTGLSSDEHSSLASVSTSSAATPPNAFIDPQNMLRVFHECRNRLGQKQKAIESVEKRLQAQYNKALSDMRHAYQAIFDQLEKGRSDVTKELDEIYSAKQTHFSVFSSKIDESVRRVDHVIQYMDSQTNITSANEMQNDLLNCKSFIDNKLQAVLNLDIEANLLGQDIDFVSNYQVCQVLMRNNILGHFRTGNHGPGVISKSLIGNGNSQNGSGLSNALLNNGHSTSNVNGSMDAFSDRFSSALSFGGSNNVFGTGRNVSNTNGTSSNDSLSIFGNYDRWSNGLGGGSSGSLSRNDNSPDSFFSNNGVNSNTWGHGPMDNQLGDLDNHMTSDLGLHDSLGSTMGPNSLMSLGTPNGGLSNGGGGSNPIKSQCQRQKMIYHCKFGEFGTFEGQFTEPSGVAINAQNDIIVADTNNHRVQIFDKDGRFKFQFGECGKRDGQLLYPNRVAVVKESGDIIVTERSPTHQIQVFNQYGQFVRKFGADVLQHPRGVTVDPKGNIVIVECKVMRVIIFDLMGNVLQKFGCSKHLEFPNGVVVNDKQEIFISDNRAHCVKVFSYSGQFLRNIGGEGLTNYPIGVCINEAGEILVADNHNNFNITIFTQDGQLINALESKVKHSQCFDVALMDDHSVVLASKDYRVYIYRYLQLQCLAATVATNGIC